MKNKLLFYFGLLSLSFFSMTNFAESMMNEEEDNMAIPSSDGYPTLNYSFCFYFPNSPECLAGGAYYIAPYSFYDNYRPYGFWYGRNYRYGSRYGHGYYGYGHGNYEGRDRHWKDGKTKHHGMNRGNNGRKNFSDHMNRNDNVRKIDRSGFKNRSKGFGKRR